MTIDETLAQAAASQSGRERMRSMMKDCDDIVNSAVELKQTFAKFSANSDLSAARMESDSPDERYVYMSLIASWQALNDARERTTALHVAEVLGLGRRDG